MIERRRARDRLCRPSSSTRGALGAGVSRPGRCRRRGGSPPASSSTSTVGYGDAAGDVPEPLRQAIRLLVAHWYENRGLVALGDGDDPADDASPR